MNSEVGASILGTNVVNRLCNWSQRIQLAMKTMI